MKNKDVVNDDIFKDAEQLALFEDDAKEEVAATEGEQSNEQSLEVDEVKYITASDGEQYTEEQWNAPALVGGPTRKEIEGWKDRYEFIYFTKFDGQVFVWRTLSRPEYREIITNTQLTSLDREEHFTEKCVLYPYDYSIDTIRSGRAGISSLLSEMIMDKSGFVAQSAAIKL